MDSKNYLPLKEPHNKMYNFNNEMLLSHMMLVMHIKIRFILNIWCLFSKLLVTAVGVLCFSKSNIQYRFHVMQVLLILIYFLCSKIQKKFYFLTSSLAQQVTEFPLFVLESKNSPPHTNSLHNTESFHIGFWLIYCCIVCFSVSLSLFLYIL